MGINQHAHDDRAAGVVVAAALGVGVAAGQSGSSPSYAEAGPDLHRGDRIPDPGRRPSPGCWA